MHLVGHVLISSLLGPCAHQAHHPAFFLPEPRFAFAFSSPPLSSFLPSGSFTSSGPVSVGVSVRSAFLTHAFSPHLTLLLCSPAELQYLCSLPFLWRFSSSALHFFFLGGGGSELRRELKLPLLESPPSCNSPTLLTDPSPFWG